MEKILTILLLTIFVGTAFAEPMKVTNTQADQILATLLALESGLTAANTTIAADDINTLRPKVEAFGKGQQAALKKYGIQPTMETDDPAFMEYMVEAQANADAEISVDLVRFALSDEEITAAKIKPATLATLRQYLLPLKK